MDKGFYLSKYGQLAGTSYVEVTKNARKEYAKLQGMTKRQPYIRSMYFSKNKIFINLFWNHLSQKRKGEQIVRAKLLLAAFDTLRNTTAKPTETTRGGYALYRFYGQTSNGVAFAVQVKHSLKTGRKDFMSVFPLKNMITKNKTPRWVV